MNRPWSKTRKILEEELMCESLKGRVRYFATRYRHAHDGTGRVCVLVDGVEMLNMPFETEYKISKEVYSRKVAYKSLNETYDDVTKEFCETGILAPWNFGEALHEYFKNTIEKSLSSDNWLVRMLAILDRRVGIRTLRTLKSDIGTLPQWLQYFYELRFESENI